MTVIRRNTPRTVLVGPVLDADGVAKTNETVANIRITKNGTAASAHGSTTLTHHHAGKYLLAMDAADSDAPGVMQVSLSSGTNDMPVMSFNVVEDSIFDALFAASAAGFDGNQRVAIGKWLSQAVTLSPNNKPDVNVDEWGDVLLGTTNTLVDWNNGGRLDSILDAILVDTGTTLPVLLLSNNNKLDRNADLTESQRGSHTWHGNYFYVETTGNDSSGDGSRALPYLTLQAALDDLITTGNHDVIFLGPGTFSSAATITVSRNYVFIRGKGRNTIITRTGAGDTLAITGDGVEISGAQIGTAATGSGDGIDITDADFARISHCWFLNTQGDGIHILRGSNCQIHDNDFDGTGVGGSGQGVHVSGSGGSSNGNVIYNNEMHSTGGTAILIEQGTTNDTLIYGNDIHDAGAWGINIGASSNRAVVHTNVLGNNSSGDITDSGTDSIVKNNNAWLYSTTENRSLDVTANGEAGIDLDNTSGTISAAQIAANAITAAKIADGAIDNATFAGDVGSTAYATNIMALAGRKALDEINLDHLMKEPVAVNADMTTEVIDGTVLSNMMSKTSDTSTFVISTDSLEGNRDASLTAAQVNAQVVDVIRTDTVSELAAVPAASPNLHSMIQFVYMESRNKRTSTATASTINDDAGSAIGTSVDSDVAGTFTRGKHT